MLQQVPEVTAKCPKTGQTINHRKDCFQCADFGGVHMKHLNKDYKLSLICNNLNTHGEEIHLSIYTQCPKDDQRVNLVGQCQGCQRFIGLTFYGQDLRLLCQGVISQ